MEKLPGLPAGSVILQPGLQHSWYQPGGPEPGLLTLDHPMPHTTQVHTSLLHWASGQGRNGCKETRCICILLIY